MCEGAQYSEPILSRRNNNAVCTLPFEYTDSPERRAVSLVPDGLVCVPMLGYNRFTKVRPPVAEHRHPGCIEVYHCIRGALTFGCSGVEHRLLPGQVYVIQPEESHHLMTNPRGLVTYCMFFRLDTGRRSLLHLPRKESDALRDEICALPGTPFADNGRITACFKKLFACYDTLERGTVRTLMLRGAALDLMLGLIETARRTGGEVQSSVRIQRLIARIQAEPEQDYTGEWLMREAAVSERLLNSLFKSQTGMPPHAFILAVRLRKANEWLCQTAWPVTEIAHRLKFSSSQHLALQFRKFFGITPTQARAGVPALTRA